jgi:hypothetical protein
MRPPDFEIHEGRLTNCLRTWGDVVIPEGVTKIGDRAFAECKRLASVAVPGGATEINMNAFAGCGDLSSVSISNGALLRFDSSSELAASFPDVPVLTEMIEGRQQVFFESAAEVLGLDLSFGEAAADAVRTRRRRGPPPTRPTPNPPARRRRKLSAPGRPRSLRPPLNLPETGTNQRSTDYDGNGL